MAKKKRRKKKNQLNKKVKYELLGLLFIFLAIFGSGASAISDGVIPGGLEHIFRFFLGIWYFIASIFLLITGIVLMVKRRYPDFSNKKLIGFYILFTGVLLLTHIQTYERLLLSSEETSILSATWDQFFAYVDGSGDGLQTGGGMIGGLLFTFCYYLFSSVGAKIVSVFSILIGIIFMTEFSLGEFFSKSGKRLGNMITSTKKRLSYSRTSNSPDDEVKNAEVYVPQEEINHNEPVIQDFTDVAYSFSTHDTENDNQNTEETNNENPEAETETKGEQGNPLPMTEAENHEYELPSPSLLAEPAQSSQHQEKSKIQATVRKLERTFDSFGVKAKVTKVHVGPAVTKYEVYPEAGVKVSKIVNLHDDLALALAAKDIRIEAPIPGKSAVGIEVPNQEIAQVSLREVLDTSTPSQSSKLLFALGRDISGDAIVSELSKMPHMLIAGATGSGKSVCVNGIITTILMRAKPHEVKMMMIDPKKVELNVYNGIPHLLTPVVTDPKKASRALKKVVAEMERRYELFSETGTRNIEGYNEYIRKYNQTVYEEDEKQPNLPYIVVLVDELADLMMVASNDVEDAITRLAQMARAAGIHLILATQRPSVDVITGVIKANIPSRIAFSVSSATDSRTILDAGGAEKLLGRGDMLFMPVGSSKPTRVQGAFLSDEEVERVVDHCIDQQKASYQEEMIPEETNETVSDVDDELYDDAVQMITEMQSASVSMLQRRFRIGYTRAARLIDAMEDHGIVGPYEGSKPRTVLVSQTNEERTS
ncbi:DNA translocase FtsK [Lentibacillus persicus]|uniref:DNA translocase FtsK n=1 Tax=Lentibacillus persicus TaxID=640948 RepID=A0A1I1V973_9BACI|nr:DNA translocase FtsK [Lentibacillus persicus]SFD79419.1 DNA translocase FtsK [Lentibacillus persicus]